MPLLLEQVGRELVGTGDPPTHPLCADGRTGQGGHVGHRRVVCVRVHNQGRPVCLAPGTLGQTDPARLAKGLPAELVATFISAY